MAGSGKKRGTIPLASRPSLRVIWRWGAFRRRNICRQKDLPMLSFPSVPLGQKPRLLHWAHGLFCTMLKKTARPRRRLAGACNFTAELVRHPRTVGAICPSGPKLAARMASLIPEGNGLVVEIGAGTGSVTKAILDRGIAPERLVIIERSPAFCHILRKKFPSLNIIQGDASLLGELLPKNAPVDAVVSSLPLMSLPSGVRASILRQIHSVIQHHGCVIQFTYALWSPSPFQRVGCTRDRHAVVVRNMPPAKLERFRAGCR